MPATFTIPLITVIPGQTITASLWNNEYGNIYDNFIPAGMDDYSANDTQMQTVSDPFPGGSTSRPTSLQGEIERLRFQLANITGETYWYNDPDVDVATFKTRFDAHTHSGATNQGPQIGTSGIADNAITIDKMADSSVGQAELRNSCVGTAQLIDDNVTTAKIAALNVTTAKIAAAAVDETKLAASVAGNGLAGGAGTALSVNVDASTIEINSDTLRVKDAGVTEAKLATAVVNKLGQNIGLVSIQTTSSNTTLINYSGQGKLKGVTVTGTSANITVTVDGVQIFNGSVTAGQGLAWSNGATGYIVDGTAVLNSLEILFKTSLVVVKNSGTGTLNVAYERAS